MAREADQEAMVVDTVVPKVVDTEVVSAAQVAVEAEVVVVSAAADVAVEVVAVVAIIHTKKHLYIQIYSKQCVPFKNVLPYHHCVPANPFTFLFSLFLQNIRQQIIPTYI